MEYSTELFKGIIGKNIFSKEGMPFSNPDGQFLKHKEENHSIDYLPELLRSGDPLDTLYEQYWSKEY